MDTLHLYFQISPEPHIWLLQLAGIALLTLLASGVLVRMLRRLASADDARRSLWRGALLHACGPALALLIWVAGLSASASLLHGVVPGGLWSYWPALQRVLVLLSGALFLSRLIARLERDLADPAMTARPMDPESALALGKLLQVCVAALTALMVLETLGFSIRGVLAFGGVGGIAIGFAAKDLLANFFGGLTIFMDKPFSVGNWVRSPNQNIEGTVEDIGWRLTRIRTFEDRPIYIPNALFSTIVVENVSRMQHFRIKQTLGLRYDDRERLPDVCAGIRAMLQQHPGIAQDKTLVVRMTDYGASTLDVMLYCYARTTVWSTYLEVQEDVLLRVGQIVAAHGADFAFPTQTVHNLEDGGPPPVRRTPLAAVAPPAP
ncbi:mechanosensitive ion channel family protein [Ottowia sp.]|uniref:mechanosensitive ion channel family protein n=1 Tax=Ottowia sp. TaxID=1898956 RepID=UPI00262D4950|nr:mechanosensitive ion channel family protein [Ottowia sp.]